MWSATAKSVGATHRKKISTHALRVERDGGVLKNNALYFYFNSRAPCGARPVTLPPTPPEPPISTHALRVERDKNRRTAGTLKQISTHALRVERDASDPYKLTLREISTHALRVERDVQPRNVCEKS